MRQYGRTEATQYTRPIQRRLAVALRLIMLLCPIYLLIFACSSRSDGNVLTVSIPAQKWLLDSIVGDRFRVVSMLGADSNPETYEPSMRQLMELQNSAVYFTVGSLPFEQAALPKIKENFPSLTITESANGITPVCGTHTAAASSHSHSVTDPHVWTSLTNARIMAGNMYNVMVALDPDGKEYYTARYKALDAGLAALHDSVAGTLASLRGRTFMVWHPSLSYFARDYGLTQVGMEQTGKETSVSQYKERLDRARTLRPLLFFTQAEFDSREADALAAELGVPVVKISLMQPDIPAQIRKLAYELHKAGN